MFVVVSGLITYCMRWNTNFDFIFHMVLILQLDQMDPSNAQTSGLEDVEVKDLIVYKSKNSKKKHLQEIFMRAATVLSLLKYVSWIIKMKFIS